MTVRPQRARFLVAPHSSAISLDVLPVAIIQWDRHGRVLAWNRAAERIFGWPGAEVMGNPCPVLANAVRESATALRDRVLDGRPLEDEEIRVRRPDATIVDISMSVAPIVAADGTVESVVAVAMDTTERRRQTQALRHLADHDSLTDLLNRRAFEESLSRVVTRARLGGAHGALLIVDVDQLKRVNDRLGHPAGDALLIGVADVLRETVRPGDLLGRLGGDEFGVALPGVGPDDAGRIAERLRISIAAPRFGAETSGRSTASIGVVGIDGTREVPELLAYADRALYRAKRNRDNVEMHLDAHRAHRQRLS